MTTQSRSEPSIHPAVTELTEAMRQLAVDVAAGEVSAIDARAMIGRWVNHWRTVTGRDYPTRWHACATHAAAKGASAKLCPDGWRWRTYTADGAVRGEGVEPTEEAACAAADADMGLASVPEPAPLPLGEPITPALVTWLSARGLTRAGELVTARDAYGRAKYGQPLRLDDGRDAVEDCRQELGDALQYAYRALRRGDDTRELMALAQALVRLLAEGVGCG